ncbi:biotin/lipoyl-containing protein [Denitratisoma oestradiolicum]|uniref:biotin/lipoyl-containing protein n=1 Tax=Denitratisoma oestradiolicum TaxID=311182 RepID=UPI00132732DD|nr:hypothetical protein CBW56_17770 [Denitratisoma oestradiolicum]
MAKKIIMPRLGMGITEATVMNWLKAEGDLVTEGEPLVEIETAKAVEEQAATASGRLVKILVPAGEMVEVLTTIGILAEDGEDYSHLLP